MNKSLPVMLKKIGKNDILKRSFLVYIVVALVSILAVNFKLFAWQYFQYLGWKYTFGGLNDRDGILYYDSAVQLNPKDAQAYAYLGFCYYRLGEFDNAIAAYRKAVALKPEFYPWRKNLALIYDLVGRKKEAMNVLHGVLK